MQIGGECREMLEAKWEHEVVAWKKGVSEMYFVSCYWNKSFREVCGVSNSQHQHSKQDLDGRSLQEVWRNYIDQTEAT